MFNYEDLVYMKILRPTEIDINQNICSFCRLSYLKAVGIRKPNTDDELRDKARYEKNKSMYIFVNRRCISN